MANIQLYMSRVTSKADAPKVPQKAESVCGGETKIYSSRFGVKGGFVVAHVVASNFTKTLANGSSIAVNTLRQPFQGLQG